MRPVGILALVMACRGGSPGESATIPTTGAPTGTSIPTGTPTGTDTGPTGETGTFHLGVEYVQEGLMAAYAPAGVGWAKTRLEAFEWGGIEPAPPVGGVHVYDWTCADGQIVRTQQEGIDHVQSYLSPRSEWASVSAGVVDLDIMPRPEHMADWEAFVAAVIERYDGDGVDDAPGLLHPVHHWVVGPEWTGFWPSDDHDDYLALAAATATAARAVDPEVQLGAIPFFLPDTFVGNEPSDAEIADRLATSTFLRNSTEGIAAILDHPEHFDSYSLHALGHYSEIPPAIRWMNAEMDARGYRLPIWIDDATPIGYLANQVGFPAQYPVTAAIYDDTWATLDAVARQDEGTVPPGSVATAWLEAEVARGIVQKGITALGEGTAGIQLGNTEDWMVDSSPFTGGIRSGTMGWIGSFAALGLTDVVHDGGMGACDVRTAGDPRPGWTAMQQLAAVIGDGRYDAVAPVGGLEGVRGYDLVRAGAHTWVLWNEVGAPLPLPGDPVPPHLDYRLTLAAGVVAVSVEPIVTIRGELPVRFEVAAPDGTVVLALTPTPVIVRGL